MTEPSPEQNDSKPAVEHQRRARIREIEGGLATLRVVDPESFGEITVAHMLEDVGLEWEIGRDSADEFQVTRRLEEQFLDASGVLGNGLIRHYLDRDDAGVGLARAEVTVGELEDGSGERGVVINLKPFDLSSKDRYARLTKCVLQVERYLVEIGRA